MRVVATAGHVDHGKSTLVRALTGTDPDRWAEEHRRGLTIDLGYAWTRLPGGEQVAFVDVPGHERFIANMLAGLGPAPGVLFVVAADEGWRTQSAEHLAAVRALGIEHGVVAVTRSDLADPADAIAQVTARLAGTPLADAPIVPCSGVTGAGLDHLRARLAELCARLPEPPASGRARLWVDRVFTLRGAGTVATGTLGHGRFAVGGTVQIAGAGRARTAVIRGLQSLGAPVDAAGAVARVAVNLRGVAPDELARGSILLTPDAWHLTREADVRVERVAPPEGGGVPVDLPERLMAHVGTAAVPVRARPLGEGSARLRWEHPLPLGVGDRLVLRDPGRHAVLGGALVLDAAPPPLTRRGAAGRRGAELADAQPRLDVAAEVARRGWARVDDLVALGADPDASPSGVRRVRAGAALWVCEAQWAAWRDAVRSAVEDAVAADPLQARAAAAAVSAAVGLPGVELVAPLAAEAGLDCAAGYVRVPGRSADLGAAEAGLAEVERRLAEEPFAAPERGDLAALGLGERQIAAAVRLGRLLHLGDQVVLTPSAPARAMRLLAALPQPFTTSEARVALGTSRRVVIPLLTETDRRGWTRRLDAGHRTVVRGNTPGRP